MSLKDRSSAQNKGILDQLDAFDSTFTQARAGDLKKRETAQDATKAATGWSGYGGNADYQRRLSQRHADLKREIAFMSAPEMEETVSAFQTFVQPIAPDNARVFGLISGNAPTGLMVVLRKSKGAVLASVAPNVLGHYLIDTSCTSKEAVLELHDGAGQLLLQDGAPVLLTGGAATERNFTISGCGDVTSDTGQSGEDEGMEMPDLVGKSNKTAMAHLAELGELRVTFDEVFNEAPKDIIVGQKPKAGQVLIVGDPVALTVSQGPKPQESMPDFVGKSILDARQTLTDYAYQELAIDYVDAPQNVGRVVKQEPLPDAPLGPNTKILLCVGQAQKIMPNVLGIPEAASRAILIPHFAKDISVDYIPTQDGSKLVQGQFPTAGSIVTSDTKIALEVGKPIEDEKLQTMPDLKGQSPAVARRKLRAMAEFNIQTKHVPDALPKGLVFDHDPAAGTKIHPGDTLVLYLSSGLEKTTTMPNLVGLSESQAKEAIVPRYAKTMTVKYATSSIAPGTILNQSPKAGTEVAPEQEVVVEVARAKKRRDGLVMPDLRALTAARAKKALAEVSITKVDYDKTIARRRKYRIVAQDPPVGTPLKGDETVMLTFGPST